jgi:response regulator RpfG family c-di-GMP phosphodiesterase
VLSSDAQKRILIIDDDAGNRLITRKILEAKGFLVDEAASVAQGFKLSESKSPHLVILDFYMPEQNGFGFLLEKKSHATVRNIPVILLSTVKDKKSILRAFELGVVDHLPKPIDGRILIQRILKIFQNTSEPMRVFEAGLRPKVKVHLQARITLANEVGFLLEAPAKIGEGTLPLIKSTFLSLIACENAILKRTERPAKYFQENQYFNEIAVAGLSPDAIEKIKRLLKE